MLTTKDLNTNDKHFKEVCLKIGGKRSVIGYYQRRAYACYLDKKLNFYKSIFHVFFDGYSVVSETFQFVFLRNSFPLFLQQLKLYSLVFPSYFV